MSKIAYDLDGVFVPDCDQFPNIGGLADFYNLTLSMRPLFVPNTEYDIITARRFEFREITHDWCVKYMTNMPNMLYHDCGDESPSEYKASVLNLNPHIEFYIESEPSIVDYLNNNVTTGCKTILFKDFIANGFNL